MDRGTYSRTVRGHLPYMVILDFELSHGIVIKLGDPHTRTPLKFSQASLRPGMPLRQARQVQREKPLCAIVKVAGILDKLFNGDAGKVDPKGVGGRSYVFLVFWMRRVFKRCFWVCVGVW